MLRPLPSLRSPSLATALVALSVVATGVTCATGNQAPGADAGTTGAGAAGASSASSASSAVSTTSAGGGGATTSSTGTSTTFSTASVAASSSASGTSSSGVVVAGSNIISVQESSSMVGVDDNLVSMSGFSTPWGDFSNDPIGLAFTGNGAAVAVVRSQVTTDAGTFGELRFARWTGSWTPGFGGTLLPVQSTPTLYITGGPSIAGSSIRAHAAFQGTDLKFYYAEYFNGSWSPTSEPMTAAAMQSTGPVPPAIATLNGTPIVAFIGDDGNLYDQTRSGGVWGAANPHGVPGQAAALTPAIVALTQGAELLIVYANATGNALEYTIRTAGTWSTPAPIAGASTTTALALAPIATGGAVLSYEGTDSHLHTTVLSASAPFTWSAPVSGVAGSDPVLVAPPAVATGAKGADAELLYIDMSYVLYAARMTSGAWGAALEAGAASHHVALATGD